MDATTKENHSLAFIDEALFFFLILNQARIMNLFLVFHTALKLIGRGIISYLSDNIWQPMLHRFPNFEKILCYQFPGLMNAPWMSRKPGGREPDSSDTVKLFNDYKQYLEKGVGPFITEHMALGKPVAVANAFSEKYTGGGDRALTDGWAGSAYDLFHRWQG